MLFSRSPENFGRMVNGRPGFVNKKGTIELNSEF
jgi:hypothetical protein